MSGPTIRLLTCSFSRDFEACRTFCESIDRFVPGSIEHWLIVPKRDLDLFRGLQGGRRRVVVEDAFLPKGFWKAPMPPAAIRKLIGLPRRNIYLTPFSPPVRGWIVQQILKIASTIESDADIVIQMDSDISFIRPLTIDHLIQDDLVRFYRNPEPVPMESHRKWHAAAGRLLGLPPSDWYGGEYIDAMLVWRRSSAIEMTKRIEAVNGRSWKVMLSREPQFAESIIYGIHADKVTGFAEAGLLPDPISLCHARWSGAFAGPADEEAFVNSVEPGQVCCLLQSTLDLEPERRREIFARVEQEARRQDEGAGV